jgi:2-dehydro-3-deoxyphosphogluconate aldolase/(4S)-4-hydroxy-2-oxoglutarate aldolase
VTDAVELRSGRVAAAIRAHRLIVVLRRVEPRDRLLSIVAELADAGARIFELTFDASTAADDLVAVREMLDANSSVACLVGAGTIRSLDQLDAAVAAGAAFGVAPVLDAALVRRAVERGLPFVPGAFSPTEALAGWEAGATFVKLFPGSALGPSFVRELSGPLPDVELIVTGGVDSTNASAFLSSGAAAVGIGSALVRATPAERRAIVEATRAAPVEAETPAQDGGASLPK